MNKSIWTPVFIFLPLWASSCLLVLPWQSDVWIRSIEFCSDLNSYVDIYYGDPIRAESERVVFKGVEVDISSVTGMLKQPDWVFFQSEDENINTPASSSRLQLIEVVALHGNSGVKKHFTDTETLQNFLGPNKLNVSLPLPELDSHRPWYIEILLSSRDFLDNYVFVRILIGLLFPILLVRAIFSA